MSDNRSKKQIFAVEAKVIDWLTKKSKILFIIVISLLAFAIRFMGRKHISTDMDYFLIPWFEEITANGGIKALTAQVGDYNLLYQTIISFLTYLPLSCVTLYKMLSCIFDFVLAFSTMKIVNTAIGKKFSFRGIIAYTAVLLCPTVFLNSAFWGQCDAIYVSWCMLALLFLYKERYPLAFVFLGIAFAFKFQTIFIVPFFICVYLIRKNFSILYFLLSVAVFWFSGIAGFLSGRSLLDPFRIYLFQAGEYHQLYMNFHSFWILFGDNCEMLKIPAIILTVGLCGVGLFFLLQGKKTINTPERFINTAAWFVWTVILFLPVMLDRYAYMLDILLIILAVINIRYIWFFLVSGSLSLISYGNALLHVDRLSGLPGMLGSLMYVSAWLAFTIFIVRKEQAPIISNQA